MRSSELSSINKYSPKPSKTDFIKSYLPMIISQLYLLFTVILFFFGPWPWPVNNTSKLLLLLLCCHLMLGVGYFIGIKMKKGKNHNESFNVNSLLKVCLIISLVMIIPSFYANTGLFLLDFNVLFSNIHEGIFNPGDQYLQKILSFREESSNLLLTLLTIIAAPFSWMLLPIALIYWDKVKKSYKVLIIFITVIETVSWVVIGTNKGIFDLIIIFISAMIIQRANPTKIKKRNAPRKRITKYILIILLIFSAISYFANTIESRMGKMITFDDAAQIGIDEDRLLYKLTFDSMKGMNVALSSYLSQGYYGLSLALNEKYSPTFGMGNSTFIMSLLEERLGVKSITQNTYPYKIEAHGWDMFVNWHTFYTWFASDITFFGLPLLMFIIGYFIAMLWKDIMLNKNPYAIALFSLMMILIFYIPANNQVFSFPHTLFSFYFLLFMWFISNKGRKTI